MKIKALIPFTYEDDGVIISPCKDEILDLDSDLAGQFISDGLAEAYTLITPTGTKSITANGENIDVTAYAAANVNVPNPSTGTLNITSNGEKDVTNYATANVNVPHWTAIVSNTDFTDFTDTDINNCTPDTNCTGEITGMATFSGETPLEIGFRVGATVVVTGDQAGSVTAVWSIGGSVPDMSFFAEFAFNRTETVDPDTQEMTTTYSKTIQNAWIIAGSSATDVSAAVSFDDLTFFIEAN